MRGVNDFALVIPVFHRRVAQRWLIAFHVLVIGQKKLIGILHGQRAMDSSVWFLILIRMSKVRIFLASLASVFLFGT